MLLVFFALAPVGLVLVVPLFVMIAFPLELCLTDLLDLELLCPRVHSLLPLDPDSLDVIHDV